MEAGAGSSAPAEVLADEAAGVPEQMDADADEEQVQKRRTEPRPPTRQEVDDHYSMGHAQFRSWCRHCQAARGIGEQHRAQDEPEGADPTISSDYGYMNEETDPEAAMPMLVMKDRTTKKIMATAIPSNGVENYSVKFFAGCVKELGWRRYISKSDGEPSLVALKTAAGDALPKIEMVPQESPVGDHQANGEAESAVREVKRSARALKEALEERLQRRLPLTHDIWTWLPRHAADCLSRYRVGDDGRTAEQRRTGRRWNKALIEFGERVHARLAVSDEPRSGWAPKMVEGVYVGHQARTGSLLVMTPEGVLRAKTFNKMSAEERWKPEIFESLRGRPWDLRPGADRVPRAAASPQIAPPPPMPVAPRAGDPGGGGGGVHGPRKLYVLKRDVVALGATPGCVACERIAAGLAPGVAHTDACTQKIEAAIRADPSERHRV